MTFHSETATRRAALLGLAGAALAFAKPALAQKAAQGPLGRALDFDASTWERLLRQGPRPAAYVFTTTYCSTCPEVFEQLHAAIGASRQRVELAAVVMDAQGARALAHAHHYRGATRIYAFDGFEPEIRQAVDPQWRNITPYVVLLGRKGDPQRSIGAPEAARVKTWLA
jgi:hypothetical protein